MIPSVANHGNDFFIGHSQFGAYRGGQCKSHCARTTRCDVRPGFFVTIVARRRHLMLPYVRYDDGFSFGKVGQVVDHFGHHQGARRIKLIFADFFMLDAIQLMECLGPLLVLIGLTQINQGM